MHSNGYIDIVSVLGFNFDVLGLFVFLFEFSLPLLTNVKKDACACREVYIIHKHVRLSGKNIRLQWRRVKEWMIRRGHSRSMESGSTGVNP